MSFKKWVIGKPDKETAKALAEELEIDPFSALLACSRGITDPSELDLMLSDEVLLCDINELADIGKAAEIIRAAISNRNKIAVFGDYDCDGVVATAIMYQALSGMGADVITYIPDRINEGYGMNIGAIDTLKGQGVELIVTVDNGISAKNEIEYAKKLGIITVVTDHHLPPETLPDAAAVVDPHRIDCPSSFKEICGAQVAFKVVCAILDKEPEQLLHKYADLLCVAILGDIMPLVNENRCMVKEGLRRIKTRPQIGISAILSVAGIDRKTVSSGRISFGVVPRINAAGRMGNASDALKLLCSDDITEAITLANLIDNRNAERQQTERKVAEEAVIEVEKNGYHHNKVIVVAGENWHQGTIGIVASRICELFGKPTIVFSVTGDMAHGSGRSIHGFHLYKAISSISHMSEAFGGHELAAGVTIKAEKIDEFRTAINDYADSVPNIFPVLKLDLKLNPEGMNLDMVNAIRLLEPFGTGNPTPVFGIMSAKLEKITPVSNNKHLKLLFTKKGSAFQAMLFGVSSSQFCFSIGDILDLAVTLESNFFKEEYTLSVHINGIRISGTDDERLFSELSEFDAFIAGREYRSEIILPSREQIGKVYKYISKFAPSYEKIRYVFINDLGVAKTSISITILTELGLVDSNGPSLVSLNCGKTELINSPTYKRLLSEVRSSEFAGKT